MDIGGPYNYAVYVYINNELVYSKDAYVQPSGFDISYSPGDIIRFELPGHYSYVLIDGVKYDYTNTSKIGYYGVDKLFTATGLHTFYVRTGSFA